MFAIQLCIIKEQVLFKLISCWLEHKLVSIYIPGIACLSLNNNTTKQERVRDLSASNVWLIFIRIRSIGMDVYRFLVSSMNRIFYFHISFRFIAYGRWLFESMHCYREFNGIYLNNWNKRCIFSRSRSLCLSHFTVFLLYCDIRAVLLAYVCHPDRVYSLHSALFHCLIVQMTLNRFFNAIAHYNWVSHLMLNC